MTIKDLVRATPRSSPIPADRRGPGLHVALFGSLVHPSAVRGLPEASEAANRFQLGLLEGLLQVGAERVTALTALPVATSPVPRPLFVRRRHWDTREGLIIEAPSFLNLTPVKPVLVHRKLRRAGLRAPMRSVDVVLSYNPTPGHASAGLSVARALGVPFVTIVADYMPATRGSSPFRTIQARWAQQILRASDGLVVLSGNTAHDFAGPRPWIKIDGGLDDDWTEAPATSPKRFTVVYAGTPAHVSGIRLLLEAFALIDDPDIRLVISGRGGLEEEVRGAARRDGRISLVGFLERKDLQRLLQSATVLVNPRLSCCIENRYNFPSKLLDYLAAGRPVITTRAGDLDTTYQAVTISLDPETPETLAALIRDVCSWPEVRSRTLGSKAKEFVLSERPWTRQAARVLEFIEGLIMEQVR